MFSRILLKVEKVLFSIVPNSNAVLVNFHRMTFDVNSKDAGSSIAGIEITLKPGGMRMNDFPL